MRLGGAAATIALLLGEMNSPCPTPKTPSASITGKALSGVPSMTANSKTRAPKQTSLRKHRERPSPEPVVKVPASGAHDPEHHRNDGEPQSRGQNQILVDAHEDEGQLERRPEQRGAGEQVAPLPNAALQDKVRSISGAAARPSERTNSISSTTASTPQPRNKGDVAPHAYPSFSIATSAVRAGAIRTAPLQSKRSSSGKSWSAAARTSP